VNRDLQATTLVVVGLIIGRLTVEGGYQSFVKSGLFWPLLLSSLALVGVGGVSLWQAWRLDRRGAEPTTSHGDDLLQDHVHGLEGYEGHGHHGAPRVGLLLLAPVAILLLVAPTSLGTYAAERARANQLTPPAAARFPDLPAAVDGAVELSLSDVLLRAFHGDPDDLVDVPLRLTGFVVADEAANTYQLTRFAVGCCAADAAPRQVLVTNPPGMAAPGTWVVIEATWTGELTERGRAQLPVMDIISQREIDEPAQPYEY
jgi:uncharacterized repeat protein (TIGR03943 family)